jgi:hypothetical protein
MECMWYHLSQNDSRNDIVIAKDPFNPIELICKRVKALPGDKLDKNVIEVEDNDEEVDDKCSIGSKFISKIVRILF